MLVPLVPGAATRQDSWVPDPDDVVAEAFGELGPSLRAMILKATRDAELAGDATQEAFTRLLREARAGRYPSQPRAWLYRTATNVVISRHRRATTAQRYASRLVPMDAPPAPEAMALDRERSEELREAVARLTQTERTAVLMAAAGATGKDIAAELGRTHGATRTLMHRARARLRRDLAEADAA